MNEREILILLVCILFIAFLSCIVYILRKKQKNGYDENKTKVIDKVRYTSDGNQNLDESNTLVTHQLGDITLQQGQNYKVTKKGPILPGKYIMMSTDENNRVFNVRIKDFVREYQHSSTIILAENDEICAVSHSVILR